MEHFFGLIIGLVVLAGGIGAALLSIYICRVLYHKYRRRYPKKISYGATITDRVVNGTLVFLVVGGLGWYAYLIGYALLTQFT